MRAFSKILMGLLVASTVGCSTQTRPSEVAMKIDDTVAHVSFQPGELKVGDRLKIDREECTSAREKQSSRVRIKTSCHTQTIGTGTLTEILNDHYGVARMDKPVVFKEGDKVLKDSAAK